MIEQLHILTNEVLRVYPSGSIAAAFLNVSQVREAAATVPNLRHFLSFSSLLFFFAYSCHKTSPSFYCYAVLPLLLFFSVLYYSPHSLLFSILCFFSTPFLPTFQSGISLCCSGTKPDAYGFKWRFYEGPSIDCENTHILTHSHTHTHILKHTHTPHTHTHTHSYIHTNTCL